MKINYVYIFVCVLLILSCKNEEKGFKFEKIVESKAECFNISDDLGRPREIKIKDDFLIVSESLGDPKIDLFDINSLKLLAKGGLTGKGPGEIMTAWNILFDNKQDCFTIYDGQLSRILQYNIDSLLQNERYRPDNLIQLKGDALSCFNLERLSDSSYIGIGIFLNSRLLVVDNNGEAIFQGGEYPPKENANSLDGVHALACQGTIIKHPKENLIAVATRFGECLDIFTINEGRKEITLKKRLLNSSPKYTQKNSNLAFLPETIKGYIALTCDNKYIYAIYSGQKSDSKTSVYGKTIHIFDWDGEPILEMLLDRYVSSIAVKGKYLYALEDHENIDLVRYEMNEAVLYSY
jgi:hypothetical protein